jgi:Na+/H+ antiporter NhaD/arsenite permease-like protein
MGSAFTLTPDTSKTDPITTVTTDTATIVTRTNIGGTATIIGTITIEIMIGTTTGIDVSRFFDQT